MDDVVAERPSGEMPRTEVDGATLAKVIHCDERAVRRYAKQGIVARTGRNRYALFQSIGGVIDYYRQFAMRHGTQDAMKSNAALKDAQRRLVDLRYEQLRGQLLSLPEIEILWGDLMQITKWLFLSLPARARFDMPHLTVADQGDLERLCHAMLREAVIHGQPSLPTALLKGEDEADVTAAPQARDG